MTKRPGPPVDAKGRCQNVDAKGRLCGEVHDPKRCQGHVKHTDDPDHLRAGKQCGKAPIRGLDVCRFHGATKAARVAGKRNVERAKVERTASEMLRDMGESVDIGDGDGILAMRAKAWREMLVYDVLVERLGSGRFVDIYGETKPRAELAARDAERDRFAKLDEVCVKLGFESRRVRIAEAELGWLFDVVTRAGAAVLTPGQQEAFRAQLIVEIRGGSGSATS